MYRITLGLVGPDELAARSLGGVRAGGGELEDALPNRAMVGATGFEPVTPSVSGKCSPAELRARVTPIICERVEAVPGIEPGYRVLQTLA